MTRTDHDVRDEVLRYLTAGLDAPETPDSAFDVDGIVREIVTTHGLASHVDPDTFGEIVARHARPTVADVNPCNLCGHGADSHRFASPEPQCRECPGGVCRFHEPPTTPPAPGGWMRDAAPRDLHQRFIDEINRSWAEGTGAAARAWDLINDAWRVIEVADARAGSGQRGAVEREVWMAALHVAIFRAENPQPH